MGRFPVIAYFLGTSWALGLTWTQTQNLTEFRSSKIALSDSFPEVAIPKLSALLKRDDLDRLAKLNIRALLGEAFVRAKRPAEALETLIESGPQSLTWKGHALVQLGRLEEASTIFEQISSNDAIFQRTLIANTLGDSEKVIQLATPLIEKEARFALLTISTLLDGNQLDEARRLLGSENKVLTVRNPTRRYLFARLQLLQKNRNAAIRSFQALVNGNEENLRLPFAYFHAATLGLADSFALDGNEKEATQSLLTTLENHPDSPRLLEIFERLLSWRSQVDSKKLDEWKEAKLKVWQKATSPGVSESTPGPNVVEQGLPKRSITRRDAHTLYLLARIKLDSGEADEARGLLGLLRKEFSEETDNLHNHSLVLTGLSFLKEDQPNFATTAFAVLDQRANTGRMKSTAKALIGAAAFSLQDPKQALKAFEEAEAIAKKIKDQKLATLASLNADLVSLQIGKARENTDLPPPALDLLNLERGLILGDRRDLASRPFLESYLEEHPDGLRSAEASLALAESYCLTSSPELEDLAKKILDQLQFDLISQPGFAIRQALAYFSLANQLFNSSTSETATPEESQKRQALAQLTLDQGVELTTEFVANNTDHNRTPELLFHQGQIQLVADKTGPAILSFEQFLEKFPEHPLAETSRFLSARAASSVNTESEVTRALERYRQIIDGGGPLATDAAIDLARLQIDRGVQGAALAQIEILLKKKDISPHDQRRLLVLAAEAASQNSDYEEALKFYDELLSQKDLPVTWFNRGSFFRGVVLEELGRQGDALRSYYQVVLNNLDPANTAEKEWQWHDKCALQGALPLLEQNDRWEDALALALRIAQSGGPSAKIAEERARKIRIDKMLWSEKE
jgi:hypothetical protein